MKEDLKKVVQKHFGEYFTTHKTYTGEIIKRELGVALKSLEEEPSYKELKLEKQEGFKFKKGDVILVYKGNKTRPAVVFKVTKTMVFSIPLTSGDNIHNLGIPHNSRFFRPGFFTNGIEVSELEHAEKHFIGVLDDTRSLNKAIKAIKEFYKEVI